MGEVSADDEWLESDERWRRWQLTVLVLAAVLVAVRLVFFVSTEPPVALLVIALCLSGVAAIVNLRWSLSRMRDGLATRGDWKGISWKDRRVAMKALRAGHRVPDDVLAPTVRFARVRAMQAPAGGWGAVVIGPLAVPQQSYVWAVVVSIFALALGTTFWLCWARWVQQYRVVRAQQERASA